jgi:hypothetical protein
MTQRKTVEAALRKLLGRNEIDAVELNDRLQSFQQAQQTASILRGTRKTELAGVIATTTKIAATGKLTASRLEPLWLTLSRNVEWWTKGSLLSRYQRVEFSGSNIVWQYYPGQGIQIQVLGTFGKINGIWMSKNWTLLNNAINEVLPLASERAGGLAWEYYFTYDGGQPPWVSGMAQATALQALARASKALKRPDLAQIAKQGLPLFQKAAPNGVLVKTQAGAHYLLYSFNSRQWVLNGFLQSLIGLYDYSKLTGDQTAMRLFEQGESEALVELPSYDTGAWSRYSRGQNAPESSLGYHELVTGFLQGLCKRTADTSFCSQADRFAAYLKQPPILSIVTNRLPAESNAVLQARLSKVSSVTLVIKRGTQTVCTRKLGYLRGGPLNITWPTPKQRGVYQVTLSAIDYAGNRAQVSSNLTLVAPPKRPRAVLSKRR